MADELLTPAGVARVLGVTPRTVQRWIAAGRLPATRVGGRLRVSRTSLDQVSVRPPGTQLPGTPLVGGRIRTLLVANRGEIAARIARTAHRLGIRVVGLRLADEPRPPEADEVQTIGSYLQAAELVGAAMATGSDAVHPGYGFLAESAAFAAAVAAAGLTWVGPPPEAIAAMGDKAAARRRAAALGIPVLPGYDGTVQNDATLAREAARIGFPILIKPSAGGGGKGMRVVRASDELTDALAVSRREAARAFGDDRLVLERYLVGPRHVEIQVLFDAAGNGIHLGERDCSTQRRNQKVVEESPAPLVSPALRERMGAAALRLAADVGYVGAGTVEFLLTDAGEFFFGEMNTRLQVEHPVTEAVTGLDLVEAQLRIAAGEALPTTQAEVRLEGHAIEARLYAEDPEAGYLPATGTVLRLHWPSGPGIRVDAGIGEGDPVSDRFDPLLAKLIVHGASRSEALTGLREALADTLVLGVRTNLRFLRWLVDQPVLAEGRMRTDTLAGALLPAPPVPTAAAWQAAALALLDAGTPVAAPWGGGWRPNAPPILRLSSGEEERRVEPAAATEGRRPAVAVTGETAHVDVEGQSVEISLAAPPSIEAAIRHAGSAEGHAALLAPMPGRVIAVRAAEGQPVEAHAAVVVIEAMKMEHAVTTPLTGTVSRVMVRAGDQVQRGDLLAEVSA